MAFSFGDLLVLSLLCCCCVSTIPLPLTETAATIFYTDTTSTPSTCSTGFVLPNNFCVPISTIRNAFDQFQTYKEQIPSLFRYNEILLVSDGRGERAGTIISEWERFMQWKTINDENQEKG